MIEILPDVLDSGLILVFCGTAASDASARAGAYYANPSNAFWRALRDTGLTPGLMAPAQFRDLLRLRIGLTDVAKFCAGSDHALSRADFAPDRLRDKIRRFQPDIVAFTSKTAWRAFNGWPPGTSVAYGWQAGALGSTRFFVLPSPSGAARRYWDLAPWRLLADEYMRLARKA